MAPREKRLSFVQLSTQSQRQLKSLSDWTLETITFRSAQNDLRAQCTNSNSSMNHVYTIGKVSSMKGIVLKVNVANISLASEMKKKIAAVSKDLTIISTVKTKQASIESIKPFFPQEAFLKKCQFHFEAFFGNK